MNVFLLSREQSIVPSHEFRDLAVEDEIEVKSSARIKIEKAQYGIHPRDELGSKF